MTAETPPSTPFGPNEWLVDELYEQFLADRESVDPAWWDFFTDYKPGTYNQVRDKALRVVPAARHRHMHDFCRVVDFFADWQIAGLEEVKVGPEGRLNPDVAIPAGRKVKVGARFEESHRCPVGQGKSACFKREGKSG